MKLISNWRSAPRMYSVQALACITTVQAALAYLSPEQLAAPMPLYPALTWAAAAQALTAFLGVTGTLARLIAQDLPEQKEPQA